MAKTVYLLGAGFARAISPRMPLLQELGARVRAGIGQEARWPKEVRALMAENFAHALSYLEQAKPWVTEADNLRHRALYLDMSNAIARDLEIAAQAVGRSGATAGPAWAGTLVRHWHAQRSVVLTLNYDTTIEAIAAGLEGPDEVRIRPQDIYPPLITDAGFRSGEKQPEPRRPSFRLLKLHGSTNWYFSGRAAAYGEPIYFVPPPPRRASEKERRAHEARLRAVADKYPFLVPPIYDKSPLLTHETIRALWFEAGEALRGAKRVVCMGYSLPESDLTMMHFLRTACGERVEFVIVDPAENVAPRFKRLFAGTHVRVTRFTAKARGIPDFVAAETRAQDQRSPIQGAAKMPKARGRRRKAAAAKR